MAKGILSWFLPQEGDFFGLFRESAEQIVQGAIEFRGMLDDMQQVERHSRHIKEIEHKADSITHRTVEQLHKTFITPIDREDIHVLITTMDDILDFIDAAAQRIFLFGMTEVPSEGKALADICLASAKLVQKAVEGLDDLKQPEGIVKTCIEINRLENDADHVLRSAIAKLFREEPDTRQLIKLKELYELLETVTDRCEDVANVIEGIVLEYA